MRTVAFFCDTELPGTERPSPEVQAAILRHFEADHTLFLPPGATDGFQTNLDWEDLKRQYGLVAVIVYNTNDACVYGICLEAGQMAGIPVYGLTDFGGNRAISRDCNHLQIVGFQDLVVDGLVTPPGPG